MDVADEEVLKGSLTNQGTGSFPNFRSQFSSTNVGALFISLYIK